MKALLLASTAILPTLAFAQTAPLSTPFPEPLNVLAYGVKPDAHWGDASVTWSAGSAGTVVVHCAACAFTPADVGKHVVLNLADTGNAPLNTTFSALVDSTDMKVAAAVAFPSTYSLPSSLDATGSALGIGYRVNDTVCLAAGAPCGTIKVVTLNDAPTINNAGSGGTNGSVNLMGTSPSLGGQPLIVAATIAGNIVTGLGAIVRPGLYDTMPTAPEPVVPAIKNPAGVWIQDTSNPLVGATLNVATHFGAAVGGIAMTRSSTAVNNFSCPSGSASTTSGSGAGMLVDCSSVAATASWYTDNYAAVQTAVTATQNLINSGTPKCLFFPAGNYGFSRPLGLQLTNRVYICGEVAADMTFLTTWFDAPNTAGDDVAIVGCGRSGSQQPKGGTVRMTNLTSACGIIGISSTGFRESTQPQNFVMAYNACIWCKIDVYGFNKRGRCIGSGAGPGGDSGFGESDIDYRCDQMGDVDQNDGGGHIMHYNAVDLVALGGGTINNLRIGCTSQARIFQSFGKVGLYIADVGSAHTGAHNVTICPGAHSEASGMFGSGAGGSLVQLGSNDAATTDWPVLGGGVVSGADSNVAHIRLFGSYTNPQYGGAALRTYNGSDIRFDGSIGGTGEALGKGIDHEAGCSNCEDSPSINAANDYDWTLQGGGNSNTYNSGGTEASVTSNIESAQQPAGANPALYPAWGPMPGFMSLSNVNGLTAHPGGGRTNCTLLTGGISSVGTVAGAGNSVCLMSAWPGGCQFVVNNGVFAMGVWSINVSDLINGSASFSQAAGTSRWYCVAKANNWFT